MKMLSFHHCTVQVFLFLALSLYFSGWWVNLKLFFAFFDFFSSWRVREIFLFYFSSFFFPLNHLLISLTRLSSLYLGNLTEISFITLFRYRKKNKLNFAPEKSTKKIIPLFTRIFALFYFLFTQIFLWSHTPDDDQQTTIIGKIADFYFNCLLPQSVYFLWQKLLRNDFGKSAKRQKGER